MKPHIPFLLLFAVTTMHAKPHGYHSSHPPNINDVRATINDFIPQGWRKSVLKECDLNQDGHNDYILIIQQNDSTLIKQNEGLGVTEVDSNPRIIFIIMKDPSIGKYRVISKSDSIIPIHIDFNAVDPLNEEHCLNIVKNVFKLNLEFWCATGCWESTNITYTFRYEKESIRLVGYDEKFRVRNSGETKDTSINLLTKQIKINTSNQEEGASVKNIRNEKLPYIDL